MINPVEKAMNDIRAHIPQEVLQLAFGQPDQQQAFGQISLQDTIVKTIIQDRVKTDCDLMGGKSVQITLDFDWWEPTNHNLSAWNSGAGRFGVYRIPPEARGHSDITEVFHCQFPMPFGQSMATGFDTGGGDLCTVNKNLLNSHTGHGQAAAPVPELLQGNMVRLHPGGMTHLNWVLACRVAYDENFTNMNGSAISSFAELCMIATKMYCYNKLIVPVDRGFIQGGAELTSIRNLIEQWSDLGQEYREKLDIYFGANMLDVVRVGTLLKYMI